MIKLQASLTGILKWLMSRVAIVYLVIIVFSLTCVDLKTLEMRTKIRRLNGAVPDFSDMILFSKDRDTKEAVDWYPARRYFELILKYLPDDVISKQLLGYVDINSGQEQKGMALLKSSGEINGQVLFWSNYNLGVLYYKKGMWPQAAEYLFKAVSSSPPLNVFLMHGSLIYRQILANPLFKYSLNDEINDAQSQAYILLLSTLHHLHQYDKMIIVSKIAIANQKLSYQDAYYYYAALGLFEEGQMEKSFLLFQKSLSINKDNPDVYYYIGNIYQKAGQAAQAKDFLQASYLLHQKNDPRFPYEEHIHPRFF